MFILMKTDVDGYHSIQSESPSQFKKQDLVDCVSQYFDYEIAEVAANELVNYGECILNDCSCTEFYIKEIGLLKTD